MLCLQKFSAHGSQKETPEFVLAYILCINLSLDSCHLVALALAYAHYSVCSYFLCAGDGHYVKAAIKRNRIRRLFIVSRSL